MSTVRRGPLAEDDFLNIWLYVARDSIRAADALLEQFDTALDLLSEFPDSGAPRENLGRGVRMHVVGSYCLYYRRANDDIELLRVLHGARQLDRVF
ncbi:MAG: type II toxin-antitoxin system RelE/ParE family toxin [Phycisphaerae bacterium]